MNNNRNRKQWKQLAAGSALVLLGGLGGVAGAAPQIDDFEATVARNDFRQLDGDELDQLRGRYVQGNNVLLFGMEMSTVWKSPAGDFETRANLQIDLSGAKPSVTFTPHVTATTDEAYQSHLASSADSHALVVDHGTGNARGVVQVIQAGGDYNSAGNDFQLSINPGRGFGSTENNGETALNPASGVQLSVQSGTNGLGMRIHVPGQGEVSQGIYAGRGLHQSVQLTGSQLEVHNMTRMQMQMSEGVRNSAPTGELRRALQSMRALERSF